MPTRHTRQRDAIRRALLDSDGPLTPEEVLQKAAGAAPGLGLATVYRNLRRLADEGTLEVIALPGQPSRFEPAGRHHHHHFQCRACRQVFEVEVCLGNVQAMTPRGFQLESHEIILYGRCSVCAGGELPCAL